MTAEERETTVNYSDADQVATVMSYNSTMANKLRKLLDEHPDEVKLVWEDGGGIEVRVPKKWIKVGPPNKPTLTDEQREARRIRMTEFRRYQLNQKSEKNEEFEG